MKISHPSRLLALATAGVLSASLLLQPAPARADKAKTYKYGAIALGAVGAYMLSKGKTVEGAAILGAGAYAYKKGEDTRKAEKYNDYRYGNRYGYNSGNYGDRYGDRYDNGYNVPDRNRLGNRDDNRNSDYRADNTNRDSYRNDSYNRNDDYRNDNYRDATRRGYASSNSKIRAR